MQRGTTLFKKLQRDMSRYKYSYTSFPYVKVVHSFVIDTLNPIQGGPFCGYSQMTEGKRVPFQKSVKHIIYNDEIWHSYNLHKENPKYI